MATFTREAAKISEVYLRRELPGGAQKYLRQPYNIIQHDDGGTYIEPIQTTGLNPLTYGDVNTPATDAEMLVLDAAPFSGITEIR